VHGVDVHAEGPFALEQADNAYDLTGDFDDPLDRGV
jgi:hypothetical protein